MALCKSMSGARKVIMQIFLKSNAITSCHCETLTSALPGYIIEMNPIDSGSFVSHQALQPTEPHVPKRIMDMPLLRSFMVCLVMCL